MRIVHCVSLFSFMIFFVNNFFMCYNMLISINNWLRSCHWLSLLCSKLRFVLGVPLSISLAFAAKDATENSTAMHMKTFGKQYHKYDHEDNCKSNNNENYPPPTTWHSRWSVTVTTIIVVIVGRVVWVWKVWVRSRAITVTTSTRTWSAATTSTSTTFWICNL